MTAEAEFSSYAAWVEWRMCTRKLYWPSEFLARNWVTLLACAYGDTPVEAYDCKFCDGWHVGRP
jgi:hypothetical protein